jgi:hypothetical protein
MKMRALMSRPGKIVNGIYKTNAFNQNRLSR